MAFIKKLSGTPFPRIKGKYYTNITLMEYINKHDKKNPCLARKFCYIIKCGDLQKIFNKTGIKLNIEKRVTRSYWNRRLPKKGIEYGIEICEDDSGKSKKLKDLVCLVYDHHWINRGTQTQHMIYSAVIKLNQAVSLDKELTTYNLGTSKNAILSY